MGDTCPICEERYPRYYNPNLWLMCWKCFRSVHVACVKATLQPQQLMDSVFFVCLGCGGAPGSKREAEAVATFRTVMNSLPDVTTFKRRKRNFKLKESRKVVVPKKPRCKVAKSRTNINKLTELVKSISFTSTRASSVCSTSSRLKVVEDHAGG